MQNQYEKKEKEKIFSYTSRRKSNAYPSLMFPLTLIMQSFHVFFTAASFPFSCLWNNERRISEKVALPTFWKPLTPKNSYVRLRETVTKVSIELNMPVINNFGNFALIQWTAYQFSAVHKTFWHHFKNKWIQCTQEVLYCKTWKSYCQNLLIRAAIKLTLCISLACQNTIFLTCSPAVKSKAQSLGHCGWRVLCAKY